MYSNTLSRIANFGRTISRGAASALMVAFALTSATGCGLLSSNLERAAKGVGKVVTYYCENITVPEIREEVRVAVNRHSAPHSVAVGCADGGPALHSEMDVNKPLGAGEPVTRGPIIIIDKKGDKKIRDLLARGPIIIIDRTKKV